MAGLRRWGGIPRGLELTHTGGIPHPLPVQHREGPRGLKIKGQQLLGAGPELARRAAGCRKAAPHRQE